MTRGLVSLKCERPYLFDAIARRASRRGLVRDWTAIVTPRDVRGALDTSFYRRTVDFKQFLALGGDVEPTEVERLEAAYGTPTLWDATVADRRMFSLVPAVYASNPGYRAYPHEDLVRMVGRAYRAAERMLDECEPEVVILESCSAIDEYALYRIAKTRGIKPVFITESRVRNRWFLCGDPFGISPAIGRTARELSRGIASPITEDERRFAEEVLRGIRDSAERPKSYDAAISYVRELRAVKLDRLAAFPLRAARGVLRWQREGDEDPYVPDPLRALPERIALRWRAFRDTRLAHWEAPVDGETFAYFPLQMQPEATTAIMAPAYLDLVGLAECIARAIPVTWKLYVKEHPMMLGSRAAAYYDRLRRSPNVRLINPGASSHELIRRARIVFTVTGTAAWEGAVIGTPAITFAPTPFDGCRGVHRFTRSMDQLPIFVKTVMSGHAEPHELEPLHYLVAVQRNSFEADSIAYARAGAELADVEIDRIVDALSVLQRT